MAEIGEALRRHERIGLDTSIFIYHVENARRYTPLTRTVFDALRDGSFHGVTSMLTFTELAVKPLQLDQPDIADEYEVLVATYPNLTIAGLVRSTMRRAAELRAAYRLSPPDALQVAACEESGATGFVTNDHGLRRLQEIQVLVLDDFV